jgi:hypothetical protein
MYRLWMDAGHCQTRPSWRLQHPAVPPRAARGPERGHLGPAANALLNEGRKANKVDARKPAEPLRTGMLRPLYHGGNGLRTLRELGAVIRPAVLTRVMNRLKALYRSGEVLALAPRFMLRAVERNG